MVIELFFGFLSKSLQFYRLWGSWLCSYDTMLNSISLISYIFLELVDCGVDGFWENGLTVNVTITVNITIIECDKNFMIFILYSIVLVWEGKPKSSCTF